MTDKRIKRFIPIMLICMIVNLFSGVSFGVSADEADEMPVLGKYDFNDGQLPALFSSYTFKAEDGRVRAFGKWSKMVFTDIPCNCSLEFKIKPIENRIIPRFYVKLRDEAVFCYSNNSLVGGDDSSKFYLMSASENLQKGTEYKEDTNILGYGGEYTIKCEAKGNNYSLYLNGEQIISESYEPISGTINSGIEFCCFPEDNTEGIIDFYLDDVILRGKSSELDVPKDSLFSCNFETDQMPGGFNAEKYSIENGECFINGKSCTFSYSGLSRECSLEFRIKPKDDFVIPHFNVLIGNGSFSYTANYAEDSSWDDRLVAYNAETWGAFVGEKWAKGCFFTEEQRGHKVKYVSDGDLCEMYIDGVLMISVEVPVTEEKEEYDIVFTLTGKDKFNNVGFYLDDIVVKGKPAGSDIESNVMCEYNFDDGVIPEDLSAGSFKVKDGKLVSTSVGSNISIPNIPKNSYVEFKIGATKGNVLPGFNTTFGRANYKYIANFVQNSSWDDRLTMTDAITGTQLVDSWAVDSFFSAGENIVKYYTDGETYSLYINSKKIATGICKSDIPRGRYTFNLRSEAAGNVINSEYYIDDITVKTILNNKKEKTEEEKIAKIIKESFKSEKGKDGYNYASFDVEINPPEGKLVEAFWIVVDGKYSKLIQIEKTDDEKIINIPVVIKYDGPVTADDVEIYVK